MPPRSLRLAVTAARAAAVQDAVVVSENRSGIQSVGAVGVDGVPLPGSKAFTLREALLQRLETLDRGAAASEEDDAEVRDLADKLRYCALDEERLSLQFPSQVPRLEGRWRLLYTSGFVGRAPSLGGLRAGPPLDSPLISVGDIFQVYRTEDLQADTEVRLLPPAWIRDTGFLANIPFSSGRPETSITLTQQFDVASENSLRFAFVDGKVASLLFDQLAPLKFPMSLFGAPDTSRDGPFTDTLITTYCDGDIRIGLGGRFGELRVFQRVS